MAGRIQIIEIVSLAALLTVAPRHTVAQTCEDQKWVPADVAANSYVGGAVAVEGSIVVVSAAGDDEVATDAGAVFVLDRIGSTWIQQDKILPPASIANSGFGVDIALQGARLVVGASRGHPDVDGAGAAFVYTFNGTAWVLEATLSPSDSVVDDAFGSTVELDGDTILIGAIGRDDHGDRSGAAYVFTFDGNAWTQHAKLLPDLGEARARFGFAMGLEGDVAAVGAPFWGNTGRVFVYQRLGDTWTQTQSIAPTATDFGSELTIDDGTIWIGDNASNNTGRVHLYRHDGTDWQPQLTLRPSDSRAEAYFGAAIDVDGSTAVIGASNDKTFAPPASGAAYVYELLNGTWTETGKIVPSEGFEGPEWFGSAVGVSGDSFVVGAIGDSESVPDGGAAFFVSRDALEGACITLNVGDLVSGERVTIDVSSGTPGEKVVVLWSQDVGRGRWIVSNWCVDFEFRPNRDQVAGRGIFDVNGVLTLDVDVPSWARGESVMIQAAARDTCPCACMSNLIERVVQ